MIPAREARNDPIDGRALLGAVEHLPSVDHRGGHSGLPVDESGHFATVACSLGDGSYSQPRAEDPPCRLDTVVCFSVMLAREEETRDGIRRRSWNGASDADVIPRSRGLVVST